MAGNDNVILQLGKSRRSPDHVESLTNQSKFNTAFILMVKMVEYTIERDQLGGLS